MLDCLLKRESSELFGLPLDGVNTVNGYVELIIAIEYTAHSARV